MKVLSVVAAGIAALAVTASASASQSSFEQTISGIASGVAGRSVTLHCPSEADWQAEAARRGVSPSAGGFTPRGGSEAWLSPTTCAVAGGFFAAKNKSLVRNCFVRNKIVVKKRNGKKRRVRVPIYEICPDWEQNLRSLRTVAHETVHLTGITNEAQTECYAMQALPHWVESLGGSANLGRNAARDFWKLVYPRSDPAYMSADCREDGRLDRTPGDGVWP